MHSFSIDLVPIGIPLSVVMPILLGLVGFIVGVDVIKNEGVLRDIVLYGSAARVRAMGCACHYRALEQELPPPVLDLGRDIQTLERSVLKEAEKAIEDGDADRTALGRLSIMGIAQDISRKLGAHFAELLCEMNLFRSIRALADLSKIVR